MGRHPWTPLHPLDRPAPGAEPPGPCPLVPARARVPLSPPGPAQHRGRADVFFVSVPGSGTFCETAQSRPESSRAY